MDEHSIPLKKLCQRLASSPDGLTSEEAIKRSVQFGYNLLEAKKQVSPIVRFLSQFTNFFALLLMAGSLISLLSEYLSPGKGNIYISIALGVVVVLNAVFTFIQEYHSEMVMAGFRKMLPERSSVLRDGSIHDINSKEIVPGDIICLKEGDKVPADARLVEENSLKVDHSSITGESEPQLRKLECTHGNILESRNMVFSGTFVLSGDGKALAYATGMHTEIGKIAALTKETKAVETPLHRELAYFIKVISAMSFSLGILFFVVNLLRGQHFIASLMFAMGLIVATVPEGLLPTVTLCLSIASKRMARKNALIKNLESVETLGSTTVICTDKTGTITQNRMSVNTLFVNCMEIHAYEKDVEAITGLQRLLQTMVLCNNARLAADKKFEGDPTETSLLHFSEKFISIEKLIEKGKRIHESPFDSKTKRMITTNVLDGRRTAYMKGAPEVVLAACKMIAVNNRARALGPKDRLHIAEFYKKLASRGERVLAFAYKDTKTDAPSMDSFVFIGLVGMLDPPREEVPGAIRKCRTAGIRVIMITGDYSLTAEAIARRVGIISHKKAHILTGEDLDNLGEAALQRELKRDNLIFARTSPKHKLRIVKALQSMGEVVTVTGDGVNDAPALKNADMGVAMGISGTEVAREASKMVLMDDNFATIVNAVEEGRTIFDNIKKFVSYTLSSNAPEIMAFMAFVLLGIPLPLTVVLILAIDLGTNLLPAIGLGAERPETDVMSQLPRSRKERIFTAPLFIMSYLGVGIIQAAAAFSLYFFILFSGGWTWGQQLAITEPLYMKAVTGFFVSILITQVADVVICRTRRQSIVKAGFLKNRLVLLGIATEILILAFIVYTPMGNAFFMTAPLGLLEMLIPVPFAILILLGDELRRLLVRRNNKFVREYLTW
ncbi:TPA: HAD-IC family P-type ATPase [Candidatus Woesearchaeota archaeon]|nr:HAD-IC family P-type ATPase [Candidatus Woesearchaeota archaeon]HII69324.1 HAD-IC family P-type ATPase [Candidatus Woesearchaeota archaeon]